MYTRHGNKRDKHVAAVLTLTLTVSRINPSIQSSRHSSSSLSPYLTVRVISLICHQPPRRFCALQPTPRHVATAHHQQSYTSVGTDVLHAAVSVTVTVWCFMRAECCCLPLHFIDVALSMFSRWPCRTSRRRRQCSSSSAQNSSPRTSERSSSRR